MTKRQKAFTLDKQWAFVIWFTMAIQGIMLSIAFTMAAFLVRSLYPNREEGQLGWLIGLLAATFPCAQFLTAYVWGLLSDRYGRRPVLMIGILTSALSTLAFGLSTTFAMALATRFIGGFFNGVGVAMQAICAEAWGDDSTSAAKALGLMSLGWTMGSTLGPAFGGALSEPCTAFGSDFLLCGSGQLFHSRPYALACIAASSLATLSLLGCAWLLPETRPQEAPCRLSDTSASSERSSSHALNGRQHDQGVQMAARHSHNKKDPWYRQWQVVLPVLLYGMLVFICNFLEELTPIFASAAPGQGGLGLSFAQLAWPLSVASGLLIPCTLYAYPLLQEKEKHSEWHDRSIFLKWQTSI
ncbi:hypothetical protein WJX84_001528 [Apatococcus fuscideae]|uniref:Major facilitator superfamily (MFS) profile domain-containing protein n=1 Tax=Apatococcus fuscideae TaxID=2026836 RepID=A0AAW1S4W9_9CHLO